MVKSQYSIDISDTISKSSQSTLDAIKYSYYWVTGKCLCEHLF